MMTCLQTLRTCVAVSFVRLCVQRTHTFLNQGRSNFCDHCVAIDAKSIQQAAHTTVTCGIMAWPWHGYCMWSVRERESCYTSVTPTRRVKPSLNIIVQLCTCLLSLEAILLRRWPQSTCRLEEP